MAKIVTVYTPRNHELIDMSYIRWYKISEALARLGHQVDIATNESFTKAPVLIGNNLKKVPLSKISWSAYDVVKTSYGEGFRTLETYGGLEHPFIISRLGTVVGPQDIEQIFFYGKRREELYFSQQKMVNTSKYIAVLNESAKQLWTICFGPSDNILIVPGAADRSIPPPSQDPYPRERKVRCIFAGNLFTKNFAPEANAVLVGKLNTLGRSLLRHGTRLYVIGGGDVEEIDQRYVTYLGVVPYEKTWDYLHFAHVGVELVKGLSFMHNNESSKIYHYLRAGLPVVSEAGLPNANLVTESRLGFIVENGDLDLMAHKVVEAADKYWVKDYAISYILKNHTWDKRVEVYDGVIKECLA
jgi:glycosyltransferase involved in cell wall biosynthesis